jgi:hypothetical protein
MIEQVGGSMISYVVAGLAAASVFLSLLAIVGSIWAVAEVLGWKRSTHKVHIVPQGPKVEANGADRENPFEKIDSYWG